MAKAKEMETLDIAGLGVGQAILPASPPFGWVNPLENGSGSLKDVAENPTNRFLWGAAQNRY